MTPLAIAIAQAVDAALTSPEGSHMFRGQVMTEEWKISVDYDALREKLVITAKRRDPEVNQWLNA